LGCFGVINVVVNVSIMIGQKWRPENRNLKSQEIVRIKRWQPLLFSDWFCSFDLIK